MEETWWLVTWNIVQPLQKEKNCTGIKRRKNSSVTVFNFAIKENKQTNKNPNKTTKPTLDAEKAFNHMK